MARNGKRRPPRPRIELVSSAATPEEAAAVTAALRQFLAETSPDPLPPSVSRWQQAALREGVSHSPGAPGWGGSA